MKRHVFAETKGIGTPRRKLCYICEATAGGVRKQLRELVHCFTDPAQGYEVHALLGDRGEPGLAAELAEWEGRGARCRVLKDLARAPCPWRDARAYRALGRALDEIGPELVHTHSAKGGFLGRLAAHARGVQRIVHTAHVFPFQWAGFPAGRAYLALERFAARRCHAIVCVGEGQRQEALRRGIAPAEKLVLIRNGVAPPESVHPEERAAARARLGLAPDDLAVGMVARLAPQKGIGDFLKAAALTLRARPDAVFVLVGGGPLEGEVRRRAVALDLSRARLKIAGHMDGAEALYPAFDVLALTSLYEGLPYVLLEGMARGLPVVATDVLGTREVVVDGESGLLARPGDPQDLAEKFLRLLGDGALRVRLGAAGLERVRGEFRLERFLDEHRKLYEGGAYERG